MLLFKVGQKVRRIKHRNTSGKLTMEVGDIGIISEVTNTGWVIIKGYEGLTDQDPHCFELVNETTAKQAGLALEGIMTSMEKHNVNLSEFKVDNFVITIKKV